jgi:demethylmenaquinone methyltransferase / 2-methoxy-6-polyprenyl-1,4-benzoquinol methylase
MRSDQDPESNGGRSTGAGPCSATEKRLVLREMFGRIAPGYDRLNSVLSFGQHHRWRRFAARQCRFPRDGLALDVAVGTADFALDVIGVHGKAVGIDPCVPMMQAGREKIAQRGAAGRVLLVAGEAEQLPVASDRFDCATIGFALRNVTDIDQTFREMARAIRPGGRVVALEIAKPRVPGFAPLFFLYFYRISPLMARLFGGESEAYHYLPNSLKIFKSREELAESMRRAGLEEVRWYDLSGGSVAVHVGTKPARTLKDEAT